VLERWPRGSARRPAARAALVRLYGSLAAYEEEQRRCGLYQLEARLRAQERRA
jgi:hypothetical protein